MGSHRQHFWGIDAHGVTPDLMTFAKGLGNGLSIGGVVGRAEVMDCLGANSISTFGGNPVSTGAASAVIDYVLDHDLQGNALRQGERLLTGLRALREKHDAIGDVRGKGLMIGVELVDPADGSPDPAAATAGLELARQGGLLVGKGGLHGNVLRLAPPMTLTDDETGEGLAVLTEALERVVGRTGLSGA